MKKIFRIFLLAILVSMGVANSNETKAQTANVNFSVFYSSLKPYGHWVNHPKYGQIWISSTRGFTPYSTGGHWAYTDYGWTWVSDYDWGWAPFHYGRWSYEAAYGWYWVPGYEWAPAWVAWRGGNDYYGWAPLSPGLSISVNFNTIPANWWVFAPHRYITSPGISRYYVPRTNNVTIIKNTTVVNNVTVRNNVNYVAGPKRDDVERVNHTTVKTYTVANSSKPGKTVVNNNTVNVYRPVINNNKTVVNNNSNNTTVSKNTNNTTVNKTTNNTTVNKNHNNTVNKRTAATTVNNKQTTVKNNNIDKQAKENETVNKKPEQVQKPVNDQSKNQQPKNQQKDKVNEAEKPQQKQPHSEVAKEKNHHNNDNNKRKQ